MRTYTVIITQTEVRSYMLKAATPEEAIERAQEANEEAVGQPLVGFDGYRYEFDSDTQVTG